MVTKKQLADFRAFAAPLVRSLFPPQANNIVSKHHIAGDEITDTFVLEKEPEKMIDTNKIQFWLKNNLNVLLIGEHGVGKTAVVKQAFTEKYGPMGEKWLYFSAATMDPWVDFIGIPREVNDNNGAPYLELVRPRALRDNQIKAIFVDEFNRAPLKVRNAIMELIQFKSINGHKFDNVEVVWAAINPHDDDGTYDVDRIDPAQLDRFHIHFTVPYAIDLKYFKGKYGENVANIAKNWWGELPNEIKKLVSPRRLDYALEIIGLGGSIRDDVITAKANVTKLIEALGGTSRLEQLQKLLSNNDRAGAKVFLQDNANFAACKQYVINKFKKVHDVLSPEVIGSLMFEEKKVKTFVNENPGYFPGVTESQRVIGKEVDENEEKLKQLYSVHDLSPSNYARNYARIFGGPGKGFKRTKDETHRGLSRQAAIEERRGKLGVKVAMSASRTLSGILKTQPLNIPKEHGLYTNSIGPNTGEDMIFNVSEIDEDDDAPF